MRFVKFKGTDGKPVWINPDRVTYVQGLDDDFKTLINFYGGSGYVFVKDTTERVIYKLRTSEICNVTDKHHVHCDFDRGMKMKPMINGEIYAD